jgi:D-aminopeptidase
VTRLDGRRMGEFGLNAMALWAWGSPSGSCLPGSERVGDRTVRFSADDPIVAFRGFLAMNRLAVAVGG